jgi:hypothetical protein
MKPIFSVEEYAKERNQQCFLIGSIFDPEEGGGTFLRNVSGLLLNCRALQPRASFSSI